MKPESPMSPSSLPCAVLLSADPLAPLLRALSQRCEQSGMPVHVCAPAEAPALFQSLPRLGQHPSLVLHAGEVPAAKSAMASTARDLETAWRSLCFDAAVSGQAAIEAMLPQGQGTLMFVGHASALHPDATAASLSAASAGLRSFAQSMARGFGPKGLHVVHLLLHGGVRPLGRLEPEDVAQAVWQLHQQHNSSWTHEMDLRPRPVPHVNRPMAPATL